jgi:chromosome transmission fidelity protein 1
LFAIARAGVSYRLHYKRLLFVSATGATASFLIFALRAGKVVIVDEAHNLVETINQLHSAELSLTQIDAAVAAIAAYTRRYQTQLSGKNLYYVTLLNAVLGKIKKVLCPKAPRIAGSTIAHASQHSPSAAPVHTAAAGSPSVASPAVPVVTPASTPVIATPAAVSTPATSTLTVNDFLFKSGLDSVNLFKLRRHVEETNLVNKVGGFAEAQVKQSASSSGTVQIHVSNISSRVANGSGAKADATAALRSALELLTCLTNLEGDGRVFLLNVAAAPVTGAHSSGKIHSQGAAAATTTPPPAASVKFVMLNPSVHFAPIVAQARSVVLLGGTMQPFSYFTSILFPSVPRNRLRLLSCQHVVPAKQVGALVVPHAEYTVFAAGNSGGQGDKRINFEFTYEKRFQLDMTNALFQALVEICSHTPGGVVVFYTSFQYLDTLLARWRNSKLLPKLDAIKRVFAESRANSRTENSDHDAHRGTTAGGDNVWDAYKRQVEKHPEEGALLFSVINGKLSEGINFSDELARCVVVVGLPYPDVRDPVLQEKMHYVSTVEADAAHGRGTDRLVSSEGTGAGSGLVGPASGAHSAAGRRLCESMCMKAVNQSIGRAIRHSADYACVVLLDRRYLQDQLRAQLPGWILRTLQVAASSGDGAAGGKGGTAGGLGAQLKAFFQAQKG